MLASGRRMWWRVLDCEKSQLVVVSRSCSCNSAAGCTGCRLGRSEIRIGRCCMAPLKRSQQVRLEVKRRSGSSRDSLCEAYSRCHLMVVVVSTSDDLRCEGETR